MFCPYCGKQLQQSRQRFCGNCGGDLNILAEPTQPVPSLPSLAAAPPMSATIPPPLAPDSPASPLPIAPPDWSVSPGAAPRRGTSINPALLVVGGIVVVAIVAILLLVNANSSGAGSISFSPSTFSCSNPGTLTETVRLPASVRRGDVVSIQVDGKVIASTPVGMTAGGMTQQGDGSWVAVSTTSAATMQSSCALGGAPALGIYAYTPGTHTAQIRDSSGGVLAQGSYTVTP